MSLPANPALERTRGDAVGHGGRLAAGHSAPRWALFLTLQVHERR